MKKSLLLLTSIMFISCSASYVCESNYDIPIYLKKQEKSETVFTVPKNTIVTVIGKSKKYRKIKYDKYTGWTNSNNLNYLSKKNAIKKKTSNSNRYRTYDSNSSSGSVSVKGYYRKNGTYVKPHTRSSPKSYKKR